MLPGPIHKDSPCEPPVLYFVKEKLGRWWACRTCLGSHSWETATASLPLPGPPRMASLGHSQVFSVEAIAAPPLPLCLTWNMAGTFAFMSINHSINL